MNGQITQYRSAVRRNLRCGADVKNRLLAKLDHLLDTFSQEHDEVTEEELTAAFGSPEEMANILMHDVTPGEMEQYRRQHTVNKAVLCFLLAIFMVFTIWLYFFKEVGLTSVTNGGTSNEFTIPTAYSDSGGNTK